MDVAGLRGSHYSSDFFPAGTFHWTPSLRSGFDMPHLCGIIWLTHYFIFPFSPFEFTEKTTKMNAAEYHSILCHSPDARIVVICVNSRTQSCHRATRHESSTCQENLFDFDKKTKKEKKRKNRKFETKISKRNLFFNFNFLFSYLVAGGECHRLIIYSLRISYVILCTLILYMNAEAEYPGSFRLRHVPSWRRQPATKEAIKKPRY